MRDDVVMRSAIGSDALFRCGAALPILRKLAAQRADLAAQLLHQVALLGDALAKLGEPQHQPASVIRGAKRVGNRVIDGDIAKACDAAHAGFHLRLEIVEPRFYQFRCFTEGHSRPSISQ